MSEAGLLEGLLGPGGRYEGDLVFRGRVRIEGELVGNLRSDDLVEISPTGRVEGELDVAQALVGGTLEGTLWARERVTLLPTARVRGKLICPWVDVRIGARFVGELQVERGDGAGALEPEGAA